MISWRNLLVPSLLAIALATPASAQVDQRYPQQAQREASQQDGLFGGLFGRNERARREQQPQYEQGYGQQPAQGSASELMMRLEALENQIRQLTGAVEQLQHRNQQLEQQVRRLGGETEVRARPAQQAPAAPPQPAPSAVPQRRSDVFDPAENPGAPGAPQTLGSVPPRTASAAPVPPVGDEDVLVDPAGGRAADAPLDLATLADRAGGDPQVDPGEPQRPQALPPARDPRAAAGPLPAPPPRNPSATGGQRLAAAPSATPRDEFALAQGYIQRRDYALAEDALREFLKKHPNDRLVADAHHWLGESLFQRQRYRDAAESFLTVSTKYERSARAADSLLRLGQSLAALGEREAACATLNEVGRKYPKASAGVKQSVEREQKRARC